MPLAYRAATSWPASSPASPARARELTSCRREPTVSRRSGVPARPYRHPPWNRPPRPHPYLRPDLRRHPLRQQRVPMVLAAAITPEPIGSFRVRPRWPGRGGHARPATGEPPGSAWARSLTTVTVTPLDGLPRSPAASSPCRPTARRLTLPAAGHGNRSSACSSEVARTHPLAPDARARTGETLLRTALSPRYLIRPPWPGGRHEG
jgi:hypothetical protein